MEVTDCAQASNTLKKIKLVLGEMVRTNGSPWSRFLEMIIGPELINSFPTFNATRRSFTVIRRAFHLALYSAKSSPHLSSLPCFFEIHFNIVLQCTSASSCGACFSGF
jgi:hypothetical protein